MGVDGKRSLWFCLAIMLFWTAHPVQAGSLEGSWSGGGFLKPNSGQQENVKCRVRYDQQTEKVFGVIATCATASAKIQQTGTLSKVSDDRYIGDFYNGQFDISGRVRVILDGARQIITFSSPSGTGRMELRKR